MVEHDVAALVGQTAVALLDGMVKNLIHPRDVGAGADDGRQILQRALQRVVQAGRHQQEEEEGQHVQRPPHQQHRAGERDGRDPQLEDERGGHDEGGQSELVDDGPPFHRSDLRFQPAQVGLLGVVGLQVAQRFKALLNAVGACELRVHRLLREALLHARGKAHNTKRNRQHPQRRERHTPIPEQQAHGDERCRKDRACKLGNKVGKALLQKRAVSHNGGSQIGQVLLAEEGQRDLPQPLRQRNPPHAAFHICGKIGGIVLEIRRQQDQPDANRTAGDVKHRPAARDAAAHHIGDERIQQSDRQHKR